MEPIILDGKAYADEICDKLRDTVSGRMANSPQLERPELTIVSTGNDSASAVYLRNKINRCIQIGIDITHRHYSSIDQSEIESLCCKNCPTIFQLPIFSNAVDIKYIITKNMQSYPESDVDGIFSYENIANLYTGSHTPLNIPCTAIGIIKLLKHYNIEMCGKVVCVIGRSNIVGRPTAQLFENENATVIKCNSYTPKNTLMKMVGAADIIVSAVGRANFITMLDLAECMPGRGQRLGISKKVIVDVGMNRDSDGKLCGDIPQNVKDHCYAYTPVPGGVGPMTVAMLMWNTINMWSRKTGAFTVDV